MSEKNNVHLYSLYIASYERLSYSKIGIVDHGPKTLMNLINNFCIFYLVIQKLINFKFLNM